MTKHPAIEAWVDFVRGISAPAPSAAMEQHLASGCARCRERFDAATRAHRVLGWDARHAVPRAVVRRAEALFEGRRDESPAPIAWLRAILVRDTSGEPLPAGVRSRTSSRHALYWAGNYVIDLHIAPHPEPGRMSLTGQIVRRSDKTNPVPRADVQLRRGDEIVAQAVGNLFGEFALSFGAQPGLRLTIPVEDGGEAIELPVDQATWFAAPEDSKSSAAPLPT